jgi:hypothetical protein
MVSDWNKKLESLEPSNESKTFAKYIAREIQGNMCLTVGALSFS